MNIRTFFILLAFAAITIIASMLFGGKYINERVSELSRRIFSEILSKEADVLVAVTRNDLILGNTKLARSALEKAINKSGISGIEIKSNDDTFSEIIGDMSTGDVFFIIKKEVYFNSYDQSNKWGTFTFKVTNRQFQSFANQVVGLQFTTIIPLFVFLFLFFIAALYIFGKSSLFLHRFILDEINETRKLTLIEKILWKDLIVNIHDAKTRLLMVTKERNELEKEVSLSLIAKQVAHDIRSPLSALNMVSSTLNEVSENKRLMIRNAIQRINDIANDLLAKGKQVVIKADSKAIANAHQDGQNNTKQLEVILLQALVDSLVSEKRIQYRDKINIKIDFDFKNSFGAFVKADGTELLRLLSNLMNNSIEAFPDQKGEVMVIIRAYPRLVHLSIKDNGKGIPPEILQKLGESGVSHGKEGTESGSGLGVYHAKKNIEVIGGRFNITSKINEGTQIDIILPRTDAPPWFLDVIKLQYGAKIFCLDDDLTIHQIWKERLGDIQGDQKNIEMKNFTSVLEFKNYIKENHTLKSADPSISTNLKEFFLIDYEFQGQSTNGLDVIEELNLQENVVLVTSRYEELDIRKKCENLKIKLLPKSLAGFVPIVIDDVK